jgi:hypothetical protein
MVIHMCSFISAPRKQKVAIKVKLIFMLNKGLTEDLQLVPKFPTLEPILRPRVTTQAL